MYTQVVAHLIRLVLVSFGVAALAAACGLDAEGGGSVDPDGGSGAAAGTGGTGVGGNECFIDSKACPDDKGKLVCTPTNDPAKGCNTASCSPCALPNATARCGANGCEIDVCDGGFEDCDGKPETGCEVNLQFDPTNCGVCQNNCITSKGPNYICENGQCAVTDCVPPTTANCDGDKTNGCEVDTLVDVDNCGFCTNKCDLNHAVAKCEGVQQGAVQVGECAIDKCNGSWEDCDKIAGNGCEIDTGVNTDHCGGCGNKCNANHGAPGCLLGNCLIACHPNWGNCNITTTDGCETDLLNDANHCGTCGKKCSPQNVTAPKCTAGGCDYVACSPGFGDCDGNRANGCETNTNQNTNHCGVCKNKCTAASGGTAVCNGGSCGTNCSGSTPTLCAPPGVCANTTNDVNHCGSCNNQCTTSKANAFASCSGSNCGFTCNGGYTKCSNNCVDTDTDVSNCKTCGNNCPPPSGGNGVATCSGGTCGISCNSGFTKCGNQCKNLNTDTSNCGNCGTVCTPPANGVATCNGTCGFTCNGPYTKCGAQCVNTTNDPLNCNTCGNACGANRICQTSACVCAPAFPTLCGTACVNTTGNNAHCGGCDSPCTAGQQCQSSTCVCTGPGMMNCSGTCYNTTSDDEHCGNCNTDCTTSGRVCNSSNCVCAGGSNMKFCDEKCRDTDTDENYCGNCTTKCNGSQNCVGGSCVPKAGDAGGD